MDSVIRRLILPAHDGYEQARVGRIFNARRPQRYPAAILFAETDADIVAGVRLARQRGWQVAVRSGGHSWAGWSVRDETLLLDLGQMRDMSLDDESGVASVRPAVQGGAELDPYLEASGRFFGGGHCPTVGVGGFLLQGGQGWNARGWGWAAESVVGLDVVTADGNLVHADAEQHTDLFWAGRGAGPGFPGVVTRFYLQTRRRPGVMASSSAIYPMERFGEVMTWLQENHGCVSSDVEIVATGMTMPGTSGTAAPGPPVLAVTALAMVDSDSAAAAALAPLEACPLAAHALARRPVTPTTLAEQRAEQLRMNPEGHRYLVDNAWIDGNADITVPALRGLFATLPTPQSFCIWYSMAPLRKLPDMAFSLQSEIYVAAYVIYPDPADDDHCRTWLARQMRQLEPVTAGQYVGDSDLANRQVKFLGDAQWRRLQQIQATRDPDRLFVGYLASPAVPLNTNHWQHTGPGRKAR
jgi:FAD/FMN-containing dehydrogenase